MHGSGPAAPTLANGAAIGSPVRPLLCPTSQHALLTGLKISCMLCHHMLPPLTDDSVGTGRHCRLSAQTYLHCSGIATPWRHSGLLHMQHQPRYAVTTRRSSILGTPMPYGWVAPSSSHGDDGQGVNIHVLAYRGERSQRPVCDRQLPMLGAGSSGASFRRPGACVQS